MEDLAQKLQDGDQRALSRLITSLERGDRDAATVMKTIDPSTGRSYTIGITGPPGAGKSTIVDRMTEHLRGEGLTVGIIGEDPTSPFSGGALLGDRIRMQRHYLDPGVFIRSVATRGHLGGVPRLVKTMVRLLDAAGKDIVLVETVGVGQTELGIMGVADTVLVALMPESGDGIQALKAGIMEIADIYLVNKADREGANQMATVINSMLHTANVQPDWLPPVLLTTAQNGEGIKEVWDQILLHRGHLEESSQLQIRRQRRREQEFIEAVEEELGHRLRELVENDPEVVSTVKSVAEKALEPYSAALELLKTRWVPGGFPFLDTEDKP